MRNKINIMRERQDITDEELERFKNFDSLLNKHYRILNEQKPSAWKIIVPAVLLVGSIAFYWMINKDGLQPTETQMSPSDSVTLLDRTKKEDVQAESIELKNEKEKNTKPEKFEATESSAQHALPSGKPTIDSVKPKEAESGSTSAVKQPNPNSINSSKTETVYVQAEPIDGYEALYAYFNKELIYPEGAVKDSIEGVLMVKFLINKEGRPEKIETSGSLGVLFDKEAVRLIEHMPLWKPATLNGKPVTSKLSIPLTFQLQKK